MNEELLLNVILDNAHKLTCFNCGEELTPDIITGAIGVIHIDPGEHNYPHSPDIPAEAYVVCMKCHSEEEQ